MGCWSVNCGISNIAITCGNKCVLLPLKKNKGGEYKEYQPATLPIFGEYNDYGGIENIVQDDNTKLIEEHFGVTIDEFATFLVDGKFTYDRDESKDVKCKLKSEECFEWKFMWIDRQVYDFMIINHDEYNKGHLDFGTEKMLNLLGFEFIRKDNTLNNYDPKRFNQLWKKGDVEIYSDGKTLLSTSDSGSNYLYQYGKGTHSSIEKYFNIPEELEYLKEKTTHEAWRLMPKHTALENLGFILGSRYDFSSMILNNFILDSYIENMQSPKVETILYKKYYADLETWGDRIVELINLSNNLHPMSGDFVPHKLYLTPQCGEYEQHQKILEKFAEINKSYCQR
jgi:hypothetical protein